MREERSKRKMLQTMEKLNKKDMKNLEQKAEALSLLNNAVEIGNKVFCYIPVKMFRIDHDAYQRPLQSSVKNIMDNWENDKCDPITVNYRSDGYYYVINGQHRIEAARAKGILQIVADVFVGLTIKEEANLFAGQYDGVTKLNPIDSFKANVTRGEEIDTLIKGVCNKYGVSVPRKKVPKVLGSLTVIRRIVTPSKKRK